MQLVVYRIYMSDIYELHASALDPLGVRHQPGNPCKRYVRGEGSFSTPPTAGVATVLPGVAVLHRGYDDH